MRFPLRVKPSLSLIGSLAHLKDNQSWAAHFTSALLCPTAKARYETSFGAFWSRGSQFRTVKHTSLLTTFKGLKPPFTPLMLLWFGTIS